MSKSRSNRGTVGWAQAVRDIVVASINKGQLPILGLLSVILLIIWKMPPADMTEIAKGAFQDLKAGQYVAYLVCFLLICGWYAHTKGMRKQFSLEFERIGNEKSKLQSDAAGAKFKSSE